MPARSRFNRDLLAWATPLLILLGLVGLLLRQGTDRLQAVPALVIGLFLLVQSGWCWRQWRRAILAALSDGNRER